MEARLWRAPIHCRLVHQGETGTWKQQVGLSGIAVRAGPDRDGGRHPILPVSVETTGVVPRRSVGDSLDPVPLFRLISR